MPHAEERLAAMEAHLTDGVKQLSRAVPSLLELMVEQKTQPADS